MVQCHVLPLGHSVLFLLLFNMKFFSLFMKLNFMNKELSLTGVAFNQDPFPILKENQTNQ